MGPEEQIVIAQGTEWETIVYDVRNKEPWAVESFKRNPGPSQGIYWHHTVSSSTATELSYQYQWLVEHRSSGPYGLPYNFIVFASLPHHVWYLNDIDRAWPHTYGHNDATAVCAVGNWDVNVPPPSLSERMWTVSHALMTMWGTAIPIHGHRDTFATACPGRHLYRDLQALKA